MKQKIIIVVIVLQSTFTIAQNIGINTTGAIPTTPSMLEVLQPSTTASSIGIFSRHSGAITGIGYSLWAEKTGGSTTNIAGYFSASGATNNYAIIVPSGSGSVGIGTTAPNQQLEITQNFRLPATTDSTVGVIYSGANRYIHNYGTNNFFAGAAAGNFTMTGGANTAIGTLSLYSNTTGAGNTALGQSAFFLGTYNNSTALGYCSGVTASNQIRLGSTFVTSIGGYQNWSNVSDGRFKKEVKETVPGLAFITKLRPIMYNMDMDKLASFLHTPDSLRLKDAEATKGRMLFTGFIAQEVEKAANELNYDFSGIDKPKNKSDYYGLRYAEFTVPLVKAVQELNAKNEALEKTIQELKKQIDELRSLILTK